MLVPCSSCGKQFSPKRVGEVNYCSFGCKQHEYRKRRKVADEAKRMTMTMDEYQVYMDIETLTDSKQSSEQILSVLGAISRQSWFVVLNGMLEVAKHTVHQTAKVIYEDIDANR